MHFVSPKEDITRAGEAFADSCLPFHQGNAEFVIVLGKALCNNEHRGKTNQAIRLSRGQGTKRLKTFFEEMLGE